MNVWCSMVMMSMEEQNKPKQKQKGEEEFIQGRNVSALILVRSDSNVEMEDRMTSDSP